MAEKLTYKHLHVILDALAGLEERILDGYDPTEIYVTTLLDAQGVFHPGHPLRNLAYYGDLLAEATAAFTDLLGATGDDDTVALEVRQPKTLAESIF